MLHCVMCPLQSFLKQQLHVRGLDQAVTDTCGAVLTRVLVQQLAAPHVAEQDDLQIRMSGWRAVPRSLRDV